MKLLIYFLAVCIIVVYIIPFITALFKKLFYYLKIKRVCKKHNYKIISSVLKWLFSSIRNNQPEMFIKTEKAVYSIKNYGFYQTPYYLGFIDKNNIERQVIRMFFWIGFAFLKNIKIQDIKYDNINKYFEEYDLPVLNVILFCPKCTQLYKLEGKSVPSYLDYVNTKNSLKIFGKTILKIRSIIKSPYAGFTQDRAIPEIKGVEAKDMMNGNMIYGAYVYNVKSFIKERLQSSDFLVNSVIEEERRKFETRNSYKT